MFVGLGGAERRLLLIIRPGVPLTVTDAKRIYPETDHRTHRQAMVSLARKGFVQVQPGPVFAIGVACERTTRRGGDGVAASRSALSGGVGMMRARLVSAPAPRPSPRPAPRPVSVPSGDGALGSLEAYFSHGSLAPAYQAVDRHVYDRVCDFLRKRAHQLAPHRIRTFKLSKDPEFVEKQGHRRSLCRSSRPMVKNGVTSGCIAHRLPP